MSLKESNEILIFSNDYGACLARRKENFRVNRTHESEVTDCLSNDSKLLSQLSCKVR